MPERVRAAWAGVLATLRLMVGVQDYDRYVARRRRFDPEAPVMSRTAFFRYCQTRRYRSGRCC